MEERQDLISRQVAIDALRDAENHAFNSFYKGLAKAHKIIADLPSVQPDRDVIDDCLYNIYKNISVHTATGGVIAIRYYMEKLYEEIYGEGERPWWIK